MAGAAVRATVSAGAGVDRPVQAPTYRTFGYETVRLAEDGARLFAVLNVVTSLAAGFGAVAAGYGLGGAL